MVGPTRKLTPLPAGRRARSTAMPRSGMLRATLDEPPCPGVPMPPDTVLPTPAATTGALLARTAELATGVPRLARRAARPRPRHARRAPGRARRPAARARRARRGRRGAPRPRGGARPHRHGGPALLRVRDRRVDAGRAGRRLADQHLGPERRDLRRGPGRLGRRGGGGRVAARPVRPATRELVRPHDRLPDGARDLPDGGPPPGAGAGRLGRGGATGWPAPRRSTSWWAASRTRRSRPRCSTWASGARARSRSRPTSRAGCGSTPSRRPCRTATGR